MGLIRNQLKSQSLDDVLATAFKQVGGPVFPDDAAAADLGDLVAIVAGWAATHAPTFGAPIPSTGTGYTAAPATVDVAVDLVAPAATECIRVNGISVLNGGGAPVDGDIKLDATTIASFSAAPGTTSIIELKFAPIVSKGQTLTVTVTTGTPSDLTANASGVKLVI